MRAYEPAEKQLLLPAQGGPREAEADLTGQIESICLEFPRYGYRRVTAELKRQHFPVNHKRVLRLMKDMPG